MRHPSVSLSDGTGAALAIVLWAVFVLSALLIVVVRLVDFDLDLSSAASKRFSARQLAQTGIAYALHPEVQPGSPLLAQDFGGAARLEVRISREDARLNINQLLLGNTTALLQQLFVLWGVSERDASMAADSLKDWVDADDQRSLNGAERGDAGEYSSPENRPFLSVNEMTTVRGMDAVGKVKPGWPDYFSVRSSGRLDLQEVPADLLQVFGGLTGDQALTFIRYRDGADGRSGTGDEQVIPSVAALAAIVPVSEEQLATLDERFGVGSSLRRIISSGYSGGLRHEITVIVQVGSPRYLSWKEAR